MMERAWAQELMFGSSSLLSVRSFPSLPRFSPHPLLAVYSQTAVIFLGVLFASSNLPSLFVLDFFL